jgi:hypothetical protein
LRIFAYSLPTSEFASFTGFPECQSLFYIS